MNKRLTNKLKKNIRVIPNFPKKGILFQDITSITDDKKLFNEVINEISKYASEQKFTKVAGVEARGFIFGVAVAFNLGLPLTSRDRVLIIDDLIATGGTAIASAKLISKCKVKKIEFYFIIDLKNVGGSQKLRKKFRLSSILETEG